MSGCYGRMGQVVAQMAAEDDGLQIVAGGAKSGQVDGTVSSLALQQGRVYHLEVRVSGSTITCSLDGRKLVTYEKKNAGGVYASAGLTEGGDLIVRLINATGAAQDASLALTGFDPASWQTEAYVTTLTGATSTMANSFLAPEAVAPAESTLTAGESCGCAVPAWSLTIIRVPAR